MRASAVVQLHDGGREVTAEADENDTLGRPEFSGDLPGKYELVPPAGVILALDDHVSRSVPIVIEAKSVGFLPSNHVR